MSAPHVRIDDPDFESLAEVAERIIDGEGRELYTKAEAERRKENYIALLRELEYDKAVGNVAEVDAFVTAVAAEYALVKNRLFNIGSKVAPRVAVMKSAEEIKALIDREVALALQELTLDAGRSDEPEEPDDEEPV